MDLKQLLGIVEVFECVFGRILNIFSACATVSSVKTNWSNKLELEQQSAKIFIKWTQQERKISFIFLLLIIYENPSKYTQYTHSLTSSKFSAMMDQM